MDAMNANKTRIDSVTFEVFGTYTHGRLAGKVNPRQSVTMTLNAGSKDSVKDVINRLKSATLDAFFRIKEVRNVEA